ncbi:MAG: hypothetical protein EON60_11750 [Alphaproteobacteria bacterium]|nr:MAG: hypothetical protein EON60_11750 [Alphaproteobacteria bacterium]
MLQVVATNPVPHKRQTDREIEMEAISAHVCKICHSYDPLPLKGMPERDSARQERIRYILNLVRPDWPENPKLPFRITQPEWLIAVTNGVDRRA